MVQDPEAGAGLVSERKAGRQRLYRLEAGPLSGVHDWLSPFERFWRGKLTGLRDVLDDMDDPHDTYGAGEPRDAGRSGPAPSVRGSR